MFDSIAFKNFKALQDTTLRLGRFTLVVGPNGSGKTSALQAFSAVRDPRTLEFAKLVSAGAKEPLVEVRLNWGDPHRGISTRTVWSQSAVNGPIFLNAQNAGLPNPLHADLVNKLVKVQVFSLDPNAIAKPVLLTPAIQLQSNGSNLAGVLDRLRDNSPERFEALNAELHRWLPEYDRVLFDTPQQGHRVLRLRATGGKDSKAIDAEYLSQGTLLALAILTLGYLPDPPPLVGFEEPDRGIHPRLLRQVRDALYRLSHPEAHGETRKAVQVIATTHSPYMLDLYRDHPDEIVIASKAGLSATFERLSDRTDLNEILHGTQLGEVWYSGVLGGVPSGA